MFVPNDVSLSKVGTSFKRYKCIAFREPSHYKLEKLYDLIPMSRTRRMVSILPYSENMDRRVSSVVSKFNRPTYNVLYGSP